MPEENSTRDRVRALVRQVLENTPLADGEQDDIAAAPPTKIINVSAAPPEAATDFDRDESAKNLITEDDLRGLADGSRLRIAENARLTPLAADLIQERRIELIRKTSRRGAAKIQSIAVGADHGGFETKENLKVFLSNLGFAVRDFGTNSTDAVDYPDLAAAVARAVSEKSADVGIIIDGAGIGSAMTANKVAGVRAAACYSPALARNSREHNGANVLTLGSGQNTFAEIKAIVEAWLASELTEDRHRKRVAKIEAIERQNLK